MINFNEKIIVNKNSKINYFITSDLHFFHKNILKFCPDTRPWRDVNEMTEELIKYWNSLIKDDDIVLFLGDLSFGNVEQTKEILKQLNGNIVFILGNHDHKLRNNIPNITKYEYLEFRFNGTKVICSHYPITSWNSSTYGSVMLHGHCHGSYQGQGRTIDVGFDKHGRILELQEAINMCLEKEIVTSDHH